MKSAAEYRAGVLTLLGDVSGRRYLENQVNMALETALRVLDTYKPAKEPAKIRVAAVRGREAVLKWQPADGSKILSIRNEDGSKWYDASYYRTGAWTYLEFYGEGSPGEGEFLLLEVSVPHMIQGLNGERTTVPEDQFLTVCSGAAGYAMRIRARSVTEVFGKRPEDTERLIEQSETLVTEYLQQLRDESADIGRYIDPWPYRGFPI